MAAYTETNDFNNGLGVSSLYFLDGIDNFITLSNLNNYTLKSDFETTKTNINTLSNNYDLRILSNSNNIKINSNNLFILSNSLIDYAKITTLNTLSNNFDTRINTNSNNILSNSNNLFSLSNNFDTRLITNSNNILSNSNNLFSLSNSLVNYAKITTLNSLSNNFDTRLNTNSNNLFTLSNNLTNYSTISGIQTLTNKTLTSTTNNLTASSLFSATSTISINGATAPTANQVLTATSSTNAVWATPSGGGGGTNITTIVNPYKCKIGLTSAQSLTTTTGNQTIKFNNIIYDTNNNVTAAQYIYNVAVTGYYVIKAIVFFTTSGATADVTLYQNSPTLGFVSLQLLQKKDNQVTFNLDVIEKLTAGDTIIMAANCYGSSGANLGQNTYIYIHLLSV